jgi:hypothetical protein
MAEGDKDTPIIEELFGRDKPRNAGQETPEEGAAVADPGMSESICPPLHRMHETRLVRNAGRMVVGTTMPSPSVALWEADHFNNDSRAVFTAGEKRGGIGYRGAAVAVICAVALGSLAIVTRNPERQSAPAMPRAADDKTGDDVTAGLPAGSQPTQIMAISKTSVAIGEVASASAAPAVVTPQRRGQPANLVRVGQRDASALSASNVFGPAGKPIRLPVSLNGARNDEYSFLMFRGMPAKITMSAGFRLKESWAVSLRDLDDLKIETPADFQGSFNLEILLIKGRDTPVESKVVAVEIVPQDIQLPPASVLAQQTAPGPQVLTSAPRTIEPPVAARPAQPSLQPQPAPAPRSRSTTTIAPAQEEAMLDRAQSLLQNKDISSARLLFEHLAKNGSARAALAMGKTYDPAYLRSIEATGLKPDVEKARQWYRQAAELGDKEAPGRLSSLASR